MQRAERRQPRSDGRINCSLNLSAAFRVSGEKLWSLLEEMSTAESHVTPANQSQWRQVIALNQSIKWCNLYVFLQTADAFTSITVLQFDSGLSLLLFCYILTQIKHWDTIKNLRFHIMCCILVWKLPALHATLLQFESECTERQQHRRRLQLHPGSYPSAAAGMI